MAFFKIRKGGSDPLAATAASPAESVEVLRKRARQRLIGSAVLVLAGVIGFPLVFDSQPRPIAVDIPIEIPDRAKAARPASTPVAAATGTVSGGEAVTVRPEAAAAASAPPAVFQPVAAPAAAAIASAASGVGTEPARAASSTASAKPASGPVKAASHSVASQLPPAAPASAAPAKAAASADATRVRALLEGQPGSVPAKPAETAAQAGASAAAAEGRFVVQVGAFADPAKAQAARARLEKAGLKTYTHIAETKEGKRVRVRLGPFSSRAEAEKAAAKVKGLDLPAAVLTL